MKYEFLQINDFVANHTGAQFFEADKKLFKKLFPDSKLLPDLEKAEVFQHKNLDERMVLEILSADRVCMETVWEFRGIVKAKKEDTKTPPENPDFEGNVDALLHTDLNTANHNELKKLVYGLKLEGRCVDHKKETYIQVLAAATQALAPAPVVDTDTPEAPIDEAGTPEAPTPLVDDKKKEDPEPNTQP